MKKNVLVVVLMLLFLHPVAFGSPLELALGLGGSFSEFDKFVVPAVQLSWMPRKWIGFAGELRGYYGTVFRDFHPAVFAELRLLWFIVGIGLSMELKAPEIPDALSEEYEKLLPSSGIQSAATVGVMLPLIPLGPGRLGIYGSLDAVPTAAPLRWGEEAETWPQQLAVDIFRHLFAIMDSVFHTTIGVHYAWSIGSGL